MNKYLLIGLIFIANNIYTQEYDSAKKLIFLKDSINFKDFEDNFRKKYKDLYIPDIAITLDHYEPAYHPGCNVIVLPFDQNIDENSSGMEWTLLHEAGHAQNRYTAYQMAAVSSISGLVTAKLWGTHRLNSYKNRFTKLGSKFLAGIVLTSIIFSKLSILEEKRADAFANKYADQNALIASIQGMESFENKVLNLFPENMPHTLKQKSTNLLCFCSGHPNIKSRINDMKTALKDRFHTEL